MYVENPRDSNFTGLKGSSKLAIYIYGEYIKINSFHINLLKSIRKQKESALPTKQKEI